MINRVTLLGNCGRDPETRTFDDGRKVASLTLATSEKWKDKNTGEMREVVEWHNLVFWGKQAEIAATYLKKGSQIYLEGKIRTRSYEKDGINRYVTEILVDQFKMMGAKPQSNQQPVSANNQVTEEITDQLPF